VNGVGGILKKVESKKINPKQVKGKKFDDEDETSKKQNATSL
jgi:hypothetical protein